jgi:protein-S-isoprenylcysteine O-methyltransferase Ste14
MIQGVLLTTILSIIILAFYAIDFYFMSRYDRQRQGGKRGWKWKYVSMTMLLGLVMLLQPVAWPSLGWSTDSPLGLLMQAAGGLLVVVAFALHVWSRVHLRQFYVERVEVQVDHQVIDTGPYALVRHPIITSFFGLTGGLFLLNPAIPTLFVFIYTLWDFTQSAQKEEKLLSGNVTGYEAYIHRTPRFLPRLWRPR